MDYSSVWDESARQSDTLHYFQQLARILRCIHQIIPQCKHRYASEVCNQKWDITKQELYVIDKAGHGASIKDNIQYNPGILTSVQHMQCTITYGRVEEERE